MASDSEQSPLPCKRRRPIISDSDSSDDSYINIPPGRRRVGRVVIEEDTSDDDSEVPMRSVQKKKNHKLVSEDESSYDSSSSNDGVRRDFEGGSTSSEWQSDWESMEESGTEDARQSKCKKSPHKSKAKPQAGTVSDSSDGESEKCPICLLSFRTQEVANPATCEHCFCLDCLTEWSKNVNTCPVDRQTFTIINVRAKIGGKIIRHLPVEPKTQVEEVQEDPTYCEVCQRCDREARMLLCDGCDSGFHLECLDPPLDEIPDEEHWYCSECSRNTQNQAEEIEIDLDEIPDLMEEVRQLGHSYGRRHRENLENPLTNRRGFLARTLQTERVRANVRSQRASAVAARQVLESFRYVSSVSRADEIDINRPTTSSGIDSISENSRGRSPIPGTSSGSRRVSSSRTTLRKSNKTVKRKRKTKTKSKKASKRKTQFREVRISELNENGELVETVTYRAAPRRRKTKKRKVRAISDYED